MLHTMPFMFFVESTQALYTATRAPILAMSCSTVSEVGMTSSALSYAWMSCRWVTGMLKASASCLISRHRARWHPLRSHQASSLSHTSSAVHLRPTSMTRLQNASLARFNPPVQLMNSRWVRASRLYPRM
jgi:hypothetical protein